MRCEKAEGEKLRLSDSKLISGPAVNRPSVSAFIEGKACCAWYYRACGTSWVFLSPFSHTHTHTAHTHVHMLTIGEREGERESFLFKILLRTFSLGTNYLELSRYQEPKGACFVG